MTTILITGLPSSQARLAQVLDAAVERLGMSRVAVLADSEVDAMAVEWNGRRYELVRWWVTPREVDIVLRWPGGSVVSGARVIEVDITA